MPGYPRRQIRFEALEDKQLLAGDVTASVVLGNLVLRGDDLANGVGLSSGDAPGEVIVGGLEAGGRPTSINGRFERVVFGGVHESIRIGLGQGDDVARMPGLNFRGGITVLAGPGDDQVSLGGPLADDRPSARIGGGVTVHLGGGNDRFALQGAHVGGGLWIDGAEGDDALRIADSRVAGLSALLPGAGDDRVDVHGSEMQWLRVGTGAGADVVALVDSVFARLSVHLGDGDDRLDLDTVRARGAALQGGAGEHDLLVTHGGNRFGRLHVGGFEALLGTTADGASGVDDDDVWG